LKLCLKERIDCDSQLLICGIEFQTVGVANMKALRPTALAVSGTYLSEQGRRGLEECMLRVKTDKG